MSDTPHIPPAALTEFPRVSVIVVNYNGGDWLAQCIASLTAQTLKNFECFIVDNGSTDGSLKSLETLDARFEVIALGENTGFARANNLAARKARAPWIACLNPDAFARPDWLERLLETTKLETDITMVGSLQYMAQEPGVLDGAGDCYHASGLAWRALHGHTYDLDIGPDVPDFLDVFGPCGAASLYHRDTFLRLGGFDERYFCYFEDVDIAFRFRLDGGAAFKITSLRSIISVQAFRVGPLNLQYFTGRGIVFGHSLKTCRWVS